MDAAGIGGVASQNQSQQRFDVDFTRAATRQASTAQAVYHRRMTALSF
jgi:hypothetical protein